MLSGPVFGFRPNGLMLWALSLLLQLRLSDDLLSHDADGEVQPNRTLSSLKSTRWLIACCCLLALLNAGFLLTKDAWAWLLYGCFLLLQSPGLPSFGKYACLVILIDHLAGAAPSIILCHGALVATSAMAFELGHDPLIKPRSRLAYAGLGLIPLGLLPWTSWSWMAGISLLRLNDRMERTRTRRYLSAALVHASAALIAASLFSFGKVPYAEH